MYKGKDIDVINGHLTATAKDVFRNRKLDSWVEWQGFPIH
jgi:hypothetical protein